MASSTVDRRLGLTGNKAYKAPADVATTGNIALSGEQTIDGVLTDESRVVVWQQTNPVDNGVWDTSSGSWSRAVDCNTNQDLAKGTQIKVVGGTVYGRQVFEFTSANPIQPGVSSITIALSTDSSTLQARLASTSGGNGASMVAVQDAGGYFTGATVEAALAEIGANGGNLWDYDTAYSAFNGSGTGPVGAKLSLIERDVEEFGASTSASGSVNAAAIQAAFAWLLANGGCLKFRPSGVYAVSGALTLQVDTTPRRFFSRRIEGRGATLDFSASGLTSGALLTFGAVSGAFRTERHKQVVSHLRILGPEPTNTGSSTADFPWMNTPSTTTVGIRLYQGLHWSFYDVGVEACFTAREVEFSWFENWYSCRFEKSYHGEWRKDSCTTGNDYGTVFGYCAFGTVIKPSDAENASNSAHIWHGCTYEQCHVVALIDPGNTSGGGSSVDISTKGLSWIGVYYEGITYDLWRMGIAYNSNPATRGANQDKYVCNTTVHVAKAQYSFGTTKKAFVFPTSGKKVCGLDYKGPGNRVTDVVNPGEVINVTWNQTHSNDSVTTQACSHEDSNRGMIVIDGNGTPPNLVTSRKGNFNAVVDWPSGLGGGGTLGQGVFEVSFLETYHTNGLRYAVTGTCSGGLVEVIDASSTTAKVRVACKDYAGSAISPNRVRLMIDGITGQ